MATKTKENPRLTKELLETAQHMRASGLLSKAAHEKITKRHLGAGLKRFRRFDIAQKH
jgi:putative transcriptional regulator